jgi:ADP-ribose pyrophosphatase YjhB (NUDIX family)
MKNVYQNSISACGCLFYKIVNSRVQLLLIQYDHPNSRLLDDFGGKIDENDETVVDTIARETSEETNNLITKEDLKEWIHNDPKILTFYNKCSKYYLKLIEVKEQRSNFLLFDIDMDRFGTMEITEKIQRKVNWFDYEKNKSRLAERLAKNKELIEYLDRCCNSLQ